MARKPRIEFPGAFYHVIARGNNKQKIFLDEHDYKNFLKRLKIYKEQFKFTIYAYSLMPNHVHMLVETGDVPLSRIMQALQFTYTQKFNHRYKKAGHLFQGRYKAILCQKETYLLELIRYIVLNPIRARLVKRPADWRWGSYYDLLKLQSDHIVSAEDVLGLFGKRHKMAINALQKYVNDGLAGGHNESYYKVKDQRVLGEDEFVKDAVRTGDAKAGDFEFYNISIDEMVEIVAGRMDMETKQIRSFTCERAGTLARGIVAYFCKAMADKTQSEVSRYFGRSDAAFSKMIKKLEQNRAKDESLDKMMHRIEADIKQNYRPCAVREVKKKKQAR